MPRELQAHGVAVLRPFAPQVRTGDTPQSERAAMRKPPPHILVTTPESLYLLLTSESGRRMLGTTRTVIVDEIHAVAHSKRGAHLALSLERLAALCERQCAAHRLVGHAEANRADRPTSWRGSHAPVRGDVAIIDSGHVRYARSGAGAAGRAARSGDVE